MKKFFLITMASLISICAMAVVGGDGSTKADAIEFDWDKGVTHPGGTLWYRVDLKPLYEEENPSLTLYLTNPSNVVGSSVDVSMKATVAGQEESKDYTIAARQYKTYTANAKALITLKQTEIYLTLTSNGVLKLSAKVFEAADLDESCKDARTLKWGETAVQNPMYSAWWKVSLKPIKDVEGFDAQVTITNTGTKTVNLKMGQSLDCPSSGMTKREYTLAPNESVVKKVPREMITSVQPDELYFGVENVESQVSMLVEKVAQPPIPIIPGWNILPGENLRVTDTIESLPEGQTLYKISVADMDSMAKYEPEFTYRNAGTSPAKVTIQMAFSRPAFSTSDTEYDLGEGEEEIVVYKKNMLEGMDGVDSIYLLTTVTGKVNFYGRFKHVREGKACKTNIDFNWETGHTQEGRTTQWYAINVADARDHLKDIMVYILNQGNASANLKASMAFSCPYIDLTETSRTISKNDTVSRRLGFSSYAMMKDTIWIGLETNQDIKFWADTVDAEKKAVVDSACLDAKDFNWEKGDTISANTPTWFRIDMTQVREQAAKFPTVFVQNLSSTGDATITAEMSLECPDSIANQSETLTIKANDSYSRKMASNMFQNIVQDEIFLRVVSTQKISLQIRLNKEAEGTSCASAIPFNDISGNSQAANNNLWYKVDLRKAMKDNYDLNLMIENKDAAVCEGVGQLTFGCPDDEAPSVQSFTLASKQKKTLFRPHSAFQLLPDSFVYINLQGNTAMHISMEYVTPAPFDQIDGPSTSLDTLLLDSKNSITQNLATQWYIIPKEEVKHMRDTIEQLPLTPNIQIENADGSTSYDVTIEVAFAFPITETMISQKATVPAGSSFVHALDYKLFKQAITKFDSVLVRVTIPAAAVGKVRIKSSVDKAFNGNTRETASPILVGEEYVQDGNTTMWYKLKTADWKKDKSLINKSLNVRTSNKGNANTTIKVAVYEGLQAKVDMFEQFGLERYNERTIKKGEDRNRSFPFQNLLIVGDQELYIQVTTTEKITFRTKIDGEYSPVAKIDSTQFEAKLLVPNVDYVVPGDNKPHWYQICIPYIRNNYKYTHASSLTYVFEKQATMEVMNTFMDTMKYNFPSRKRTVNKSNKHYVDTKPLSDLLNKGIARVSDQTFDITSFQEDFVDSMLHRYITSDSITMYIRYKTDADMTVRLNMPQIKGQTCFESVKFDWEHGYVNPADSTNFIHVQMDSTRVPEGKDLVIHMDRWADVSTKVKASIFAEDCDGDPLGTINKTIDQNTFKILERNFLKNINWSGLMIQYYSDTTTHVWADLIDAAIPDTVRDTIPMLVCKGDSLILQKDTIKDTIYFHQDTSIIVLEDSLDKSDAKYYVKKTLYNVRLLQKPDLNKLDIQINDLLSMPVIKSGAAVDVTASTTEIDSILNVNHKDSIQAVDTIVWEYYYINEDDFVEFPTPVLTSTAIALRYYLATECGDTIYSDPYIKIPRHTDIVDTCGTYHWKTAHVDKTYDKAGTDTLDSVIVHIWAGGPWPLDSVGYLRLTITPDTLPAVVVDTCAKSYYWAFSDKTYTATADWTEYIEMGTDPVSGCFQVDTLKLKYTPEVLPTVTVDTCAKSYTWPFNNKTYTATAAWTEYVDTVPDAGGCYQVDTLKLKFTPEVLPTVTVDTCLATYTWSFNGKPYTPTATWTEYVDTVPDAGGCYQVDTLKLKLTPDTAKTEYETVCKFPYTWNNRAYDAPGVYDTTILSGTCYVYYTLDLKEITPIFKQDTFVACNEYTLNGITYQDSTIVNDTVQTDYDCDSIITTHHIHITHPVIKTLSIVPKYGDRILMINRNEINDSTAMYLDLETDQDKVVWYVEDPAGDKPVGKTGYYLTNPDASRNGKYIQTGKTYYAKIEIPGDSVNCGYMAETKHWTIKGGKSAPALMPSLARPGQDLEVLNLNPEETTTIRVYTSEGLIQGTYTARGEETFHIQAAKDHGFYLVELRSDSDQSTLRYIVK